MRHGGFTRNHDLQRITLVPTGDLEIPNLCPSPDAGVPDLQTVDNPDQHPFRAFHLTFVSLLDPISLSRRWPRAAWVIYLMSIITVQYQAVLRILIVFGDCFFQAIAAWYRILNKHNSVYYNRHALAHAKRSECSFCHWFLAEAVD